MEQSKYFGNTTKAFSTTHFEMLLTTDAKNAMNVFKKYQNGTMSYDKYKSNILLLSKQYILTYFAKSTDDDIIYFYEPVYENGKIQKNITQTGFKKMNRIYKKASSFTVPAISYVKNKETIKSEF
jgi:ABC-type long-subunit fatty acid transport system fused permease/ATPase subunit